VACRATCLSGRRRQLLLTGRCRARVGSNRILQAGCQPWRWSFVKLASISRRLRITHTGPSTALKPCLPRDGKLYRHEADDLAGFVSKITCHGMDNAPEVVQLACENMATALRVAHEQTAGLCGSIPPGATGVLVDLKDASGPSALKIPPPMPERPSRKSQGQLTGSNKHSHIGLTPCCRKRCIRRVGVRDACPS
jgi:hypothetical protein